MNWTNLRADHPPGVATIALLIFAAVALVGCASDSASSGRMSGQALAERDCGACHATGPSDRSKMPGAPMFRTLGDRYELEGLAEALAEGISVGHPSMPELAYPQDQVVSLIAYLKSLQTEENRSRRR